MVCEYLVTGGTGFIGNELVRQLKRLGRTVAILDNGSRIAPQIDDLRSVPLYSVDIVDHEKVTMIVRELRPRVVMHLAAIHFIPECNANPERTIRVNVEATLGLLRACSGAGVEHVIFASSGAVYQDSADPLDEASPVRPVDIYAWTKLHAEQLCRWHAEAEGLSVTACRLFNNYGPRETNAHILPEIIQQLRSSNTLYLGNVTPRRDYVHTSDTARALILLAHRHPRPASFQVVNVASGQDASVEQLVRIISQALGREVVVVRDPTRFRKVDKAVQIADVSLLKSLTGWSREVDFDDGLRGLLEFEGLVRRLDRQSPSDTTAAASQL